MVEDVVTEEVVAEVPVVEDVVTEEVVAEVPVVEDVVDEEIVVEIPETEAPIAEAPVTEEIVSESPAVTDPTTTDDGTDTSVDTAGAVEGSAPKLSDESVSKSADTEAPAAETKVTRSAPKAGVGGTAPKQRAVRSVRSSA